MYIPDQLPDARLFVTAFKGALSCRRVDSGFIVKAIQITACFLEVANPFLWLGDHHVAVEGAATVGGGGCGDVGADCGDDWGAPCYVGDEVAVHYIDCMNEGKWC